MERIALKSLHLDETVYPREKWHTGTINQYIDALKAGEQFPPITVEKGTSRILDGVHRWKAHERYLALYQEHLANPDMLEEDSWAPAIDDIAVEWVEVPQDIPAKLFAAGLSARHGDRITSSESKAIAREIFTAHPDFNLATIAQYLPIAKSTIAGFVADIRAKRREEQRILAYRLHRLGWTQEEIAEQIESSRDAYTRGILCDFPELEKNTKKLLAEGLPHTEVAKRFNMEPILVWAINLAGQADKKRCESLGLTMRPYDVWSFTKCADLFGGEYAGRIPGQLIAHVLYFYTEPGAVIVDPMAGGGTTVDVCLAFGRKCYAYDIKSVRPDIIQHDLTQGWPERVKKSNLIFWDPPYFDKQDDSHVEGGYAESISKLPITEYMEFFKTKFTAAHQLVRPGTRLAFLMSDWDDEIQQQQKGLFIWDYANLLIEAGWHLLRHIQAPLPTQQIDGAASERFLQQRRLKTIGRYLLIAEA